MTITTTEVRTPDLDKIDDLLDWAAEQKDRQDAGLPSEWEQGTWFTPGAELDGLLSIGGAVPDPSVNCGTACCVAGKALFDEGRLAVAPRYGDILAVHPVDATGVIQVDAWDEMGAEVLGLDRYEAELLFAGNNDLNALRFVRDLIAQRHECDSQWWVSLDEIDSAARTCIYDTLTSYFVGGEL